MSVRLSVNVWIYVQIIVRIFVSVFWCLCEYVPVLRAVRSCVVSLRLCVGVFHFYVTKRSACPLSQLPQQPGRPCVRTVDTSEVVDTF